MDLRPRAAHWLRALTPAGVLALLFLLLALPFLTRPAAAAPQGLAVVQISEIRIDQPGGDVDEYFELAGTPGASLNGLTYLVIGDGTGGSGVIEAVVPLTGNVIPADGYFLAALDATTLGQATDFVTPAINFENSDNVTHLLVQGFSGSLGDDLDTNDDGTLDSSPWAAEIDRIALVEEENPPTATEYHYGPPSVGPDGSFAPGHVYYCEATGWQIGQFEPVGGDDTPGMANSGCPIVVDDVVGVQKDGPAAALAGDTLVYTITISNATPITAADVTLTDTLPMSTTYVADDSGVMPTMPMAGTYVWEIGAIGPMVTVTINLTVATDAALMQGTVLTNTAQVDTSSVGDDPINNQDTATTLIYALLRIHDIQGADHYSPYEGQTVAQIPGIVTALRSNSFYMEDPLPDGDEATSEAILVFTGGAPTVTVGDSVLVDGRVVEFIPGGAGTSNLPTTQLTNVTVQVVSGGNPLPGPTIVGVGGRVPPMTIIDNDTAGTVETSGVFDPAEDGLDFYESMEAMRLQVNDAQVVGPTNNFGEITVVSDAGANASVMTPRGGIVIRPDDYNPERIQIDDAIVGAEPAVEVGDLFTAPIIGVLDYNFGAFKLLNSEPLPATTGDLAREMTTAASANELSVATFNVLNLGGTSDQAQFDGLADQIVNHMMSPDIIAVQEIQDNNGPTNDGTTDASTTYARLIAAIQAADGPVYDWRDIAPLDNQDGGQPGGNIRPGFLFRTDRVTFVDRGMAGPNDSTQVVAGPYGVQLTLSPGRIDPTNLAFDDSRKVLAGEVIFNGQHLIIVSAHFNSKGGDDPLFGRFQPPVLDSELQREQQAAIVNAFVDSALAIDGEAMIALGGDLNDFQFSEPLQILTGDSDGNTVLADLIETLPIGEQYTYIFEGNSQVLDHILSSDALTARATLFDVVHVNAEYPASNRASDHDPAVAHFYLPYPDASFSAANYLVPENEGSAVITVTLTVSQEVTRTVEYSTMDGSAIAPADYIATSGTLTFTPGMTLTTFAVPIVDDSEAETNETVILTLGSPALMQSLSGGIIPTATLTIVDDDVPTAVTLSGVATARTASALPWLALLGTLGMAAAAIVVVRRRR